MFQLLKIINLSFRLRKQNFILAINNYYSIQLRLLYYLIFFFFVKSIIKIQYNITYTYIIIIIILPMIFLTVFDKFRKLSGICMISTF